MFVNQKIFLKNIGNIVTRQLVIKTPRYIHKIWLYFTLPQQIEN